ncbi:hypothetical protein KJW57_00050 [Streptococcus lutetiensis]|uniref:hypothetical protein n=1 Tax=Streptococcus lutetiensis TaxID=150055 RepID=UPI001BDA50A6|nr:hypothetical protein [Streptococcus lutetiensis]MBT0897632.1 hypothetical protein [Streptococcus lutetiensis]MBT1056384.1 hypothetical protein [Streptococcus lutetiensis]MBT1058139.1 hypothetical protein [Streptococcus lutetiensis]
MSKNNVRIAIRDSTDSHNVAFFDNKAGIKYKSANLHRFLAGSASILTIKYNSKDIDSIRSGCKLAFRYKNRDYWLNVMSFEKKGFEVELTAYSLGLELNNETRGEHKPANAMSIAEYVAYYDPEHALTIGVNEVSDKRIKLEWTGTDTILARLFSVANSFGAELDFNVELNDDYSLKRQVLNIYKKGNLGTNKVSQPVRVGKELKVINYSDNIKELRTAVRATGKDGLTIDGLNKKIYDNNKELLYYSSGMTVYAPQSRDRFPSVGKGSNDNWIVEDLGETQYETKEALWGYMYGEIQKKSLPEITYEVEGAIEAGIGDTQTLIDDIHFEPALYVQARVSELEDDILTGKVTNSTFINFERKYSQIADSLLKQVEALAEEAAPYIVRLSTDNGYNFKNGQGTSTITAKLEKYSKIVNAKWKWLINNSVVSETSSVKINASQVNGTLNVVAVAIVGGNEAAREYITLTNADDGVGIKSITRYYTTNDKAEGVTAGGQNWSTKPTTPTADKKYMWSYDVITYTNDTSLVTKPAVIGARGDDGLDADTTGITEALNKAKQELTEKIEKARNDSLEAAEEAKQQLTTVANDLSKAKTDLQKAVSAVDTKATNLQSNLTEAKQDLTSQAQQLQAQASAQSELTKRVSSVEKTANGTKTTVSELSKTVAQNGKDITSVTARTKVVEDDLSGTKTTLSQVKTTADSISQKTATLETGLNGLSAKFDNLKIGGHNYLLGTSDQYQTLTSDNYLLGTTGNGNMSFLDLLKPLKGETVTIRSYIKNDTDFPVRIQIWFTSGGIYGNPVPAHEEGYSVATGKILENFASCNIAFTQVGDGTKNGGTIQHKEDKLEKGNIATDYSPNDADFEQKVAEYKQNADQNYASLQSTVQALDGTVTANKATADQTAAGFKTRIESLETYKDSETTRASQYFELAKTETARQLTAERTAIAKDYVAKSTYTSDVTGIRNDLTATTTTANTTKQNLANYQASNDKAVANLKSNLQTANGNISSLQTKIEAVPGQITSAVSSVEGKIPTEIGGRNYIRNYGLTASEWKTVLSQWTFEIIPDGTAKSGQCLKATCTQSGAGGIHKILVDLRGAEWQSKKMTYSIDIKASKPIQMSLGVEAFSENTQSFGVSTDWQRFSYSSTINFRKGYSFVFYSANSSWTAGDVLYLRDVQLEDGTIATAPKPAVEDAQSDITKLSSEIKQTADGMTLLATKTELNTAKSDLQNAVSAATSKADNAQAIAANYAKTISTHTAQISALNTGLFAKVSQTDFNTLSGRVTTAENNITAKANELSSKISSVEGKIPTSVGGRNYLRGTSDEYQTYTSTNYILGYPSTYRDWTKLLDPLRGKTVMLRAYIKNDTNHPVRIQIWFTAGGIYGNTVAPHSEGWSVGTGKMSADWTSANVAFVQADGTATGGTIQAKKAKLEIGNIPSDWSPAPEDYDSKLASAQSEIKQTTDAITASVSSVQTAASNAQSTANTAVSKADAAQTGVNTLDSTTVKSASLTINTDGIVMKAGKSTTDVANAIGSYFAVNQNAINLFADKIKVKGDMIVDGAITADKFKAARITSLNGATTFDLDSGNITFKKNLATINQVNGNYKSEVSLSSIKASIPAGDWSSVSTIAMDSTSFNTSKRRAGLRVDMMPTYSTTLITGETISFAGETESLGTVANSVSVTTEAAYLDVINKDTKGPSGQWNYPMIMDFGINAAIRVPDIKMGGYTKSLKGILNDLCRKAGILWT